MTSLPVSAPPAAATNHQEAALADSSRGYLPTLDGWRAIAVVMVIVGHAVRGGSCGADGGSPWCSYALLGGHGVAIFFGISGFLICARLLEEVRIRGALSLRGFYLRRAFRILPPVMLYLTVIAVLTVTLDLPVTKPEWIAALLFVRDYVGWHAQGWYTGHLWSLSVEEKYYLLWPLFFVRLSSRRLLSVSLAVALLVTSWRLFDGHVGLTVRWFDLPLWTNNLRWDTRIDALACGAAAALLLQARETRERLAQSLRGAGQYALLLALVGFLAVAPRLRPGVSSAIEAVLVPALLVSTVFLPATRFGRLLESPLLRWVGRVSYGLYLWQQLFLPERGTNHLGWLQEFPGNITMTVLCATASYYVMERPLIRLGHRLATPATPGRLT